MQRLFLVSALAIACKTPAPEQRSPNAVALAPSAQSTTSAAISSSAPTPAASTGAEALPSSTPPPASSALDGATLEPSATPLETTTAVALPAFEIETPYLAGQIARPAGKMAASIFDEQLARWNTGGSSDPLHPSNRPNFHPAARVVVDVSALNRSLPDRATPGHYASVASLLAEARNQGYWAFRTCFEQGLRENAELNGQVRMRLRLSTNGRVLSARLASTRLASRAAVDCVVRAASLLSFHKPPARRTDVELSVKFWPGDAPLPPLRESAQRFNRQIVTEALAASSTEIAQCCADALSRDQRLWGRLAFSLQADSSGHLQSARESESRFPDRAASECMRAALLRAPALPASVAPQFVFAVRCGHPPAQAPGSAPASPAETAPADPPTSAPEGAPDAAN